MKPYKINSDCSLTIEDIKAMAKTLDADDHVLDSLSNSFLDFASFYDQTPVPTDIGRIAKIIDGKKAVTDLMCLKLFQEFFDIIPRNSADYRWARLVLNLALKELRRYK
jgi:hypothetical protein